MDVSLRPLGKIAKAATNELNLVTVYVTGEVLDGYIPNVQLAAKLNVVLHQSRLVSTIVLIMGAHSCKGSQ